MTLEIVADGIEFAEGPVALANGDVLVVEVMAGRLTRICPDGTKSTVAVTGGGPNGAAIGPDQRCYLCNNGGIGRNTALPGYFPASAPLDTPPGSIQVIDLPTGAVQTLYAHTEQTPFWGPNDIVFDRAGGFWFTDMGRDRGRIRQRGSVYYAKPDGSFITEAIPDLDGPNGIGLSPDENTLYVAETYSGHVLSFALSGPGVVNRAPHSITGGSFAGRGLAGQYLDSLAVDSAGNICVASPGQGAILVFPPDGGPHETIPMPDFLTTNIAFGGPDLTTAYITLGTTGRLARMEWPRPGLRLNFQQG